MIRRSARTPSDRDPPHVRRHSYGKSVEDANASLSSTSVTSGSDAVGVQAASILGGVSVVEWRHGGHRLSYVAAIARSANQASIEIELVTSSAVESSDEYRIHLAQLVDDRSLLVRTSERLASGRGLSRELRSIRDRHRAAVLPEADKFLHVLLVAKLLRRLPVPTVAIVMRPPRSGGGWRDRIRAMLKTALVLAASPLPALDVQLLEDPLAEGDERVWRSRLLRSAKWRLNDPCALLETPASNLPPELAEVTIDRSVLAIVGVIDSRKQLPLVLAGWQFAGADGDLVIAGKQSPDVSAWLRSFGPLPKNVYFVDRYLTDSEVRAIVERSRGILLLYDGGFSSGFMVAAAAAGRWAITIVGSRTGRVASSQGFGVPSEATPAGVAFAIKTVLTNQAMPPAVSVPGPTDFGRCILRRVIETRASQCP